MEPLDPPKHATKPSDSNGEILFHLEYDIIEDIPAEIEEFVRLSRLGLITDARNLFDRSLKEHLNLFPVLAEYSGFLLEQDDRRAVEECSELLRGYIESDEGAFSEDEVQVLRLLGAFSDLRAYGNQARKFALDTARSWRKGCMRTDTKLDKPDLQRDEVVIQGIEIYVAIVAETYRATPLSLKDEDYTVPGTREEHTAGWGPFKCWFHILNEEQRFWEAQKVLSSLLKVLSLGAMHQFYEEYIKTLRRFNQSDAYTFSRIAAANNYITVSIERATSEDLPNRVRAENEEVYTLLLLLKDQGALQGCHFEQWQRNCSKLQELQFLKTPDADQSSVIKEKSSKRGGAQAEGPECFAIGHLVDANERAARYDELSLTPSIPWLGFDHETTTHPIVFIEEYPLQRNWTREEICRLELGEAPPSRSLNEVLSMIQSWFFFGLLESAFGAPFRTRDYVRNHNGQSLIDTTELRTFIDNYQTSLLSNQVKGSVLQERQEAIVHSLRYAAAWNNRLAVFSAFAYPLASDPKGFTHIARLTVLVGEAVWAVGQQFPSPETRFFIDCTWRLEPGYELELKRRVTSRGWCPSLFDRMNNFARLPASFLEYMSIYPCLKIAPNHHQICQTRCLEYNVSDPSTYQATHRQEGCNCQNVRFPLQAIEDALRTSSVPVVDADELLTSSSNNFIKSWSPSTRFKFVAFSHVWSDGLGSDTERGLPTCQVEYLRDLAMKASGTPYIWIDSLCIPRHRDLRNLALSRMSESYRSSYATIVLDNGIRRCSTLGSYQAQLLAVSLSTWQERLWTLSESVLSTRVIFALENELKSSKDLLDLAATDIHMPVIRIGLTLLDNLSHGIYAGDVTIGALQRNLCRRTSSWLGDESLAVATIMGIDLAPLLEVNDDERMMRFWKLAKRVPRDIIIETSPKFPVDGFRWAPKSLMDLKCDVMMDFKDQSAVVTDDGLCGKFFLYRFHFPGPMMWSRTLTFFETTTKCCLSLERQDSTTEYTLLPGDVACFANKLNVSQPLVGALLRLVQHGAGTRPTFRYGTLAIARLDPYESLGGAEGLLGNLLMGAVGWMSSFLTRADEEYTEIVIC